MIHISKAHKVVGVPLREDLRNLFPDAPTVTFSGNPTILLPHGFTETKLLRNVGFDVPAPILTHYDWAGGTPFEVQRKTAALLTTNQRAYVLNGMGTGKTKSALWAYDYLRKEGLAKRALVVAPLSTLNFTWGKEIFQTLPHLTYSVLHGTKAKRLSRLNDLCDIYIINPDGLGVVFDELRNRPDIDCLVLDELAMFRNGTAQRSKTARALAERMTWCWGMTGSPTPNEPTDAWAQCRIITPHTVPKYYGRFRDMTMNKITTFKYAAKQEAPDIVLQAMQPAVRFTLDDVIELPDVVERVVDIEVGKEQSRVYKELKDQALAMVNDGTINAANAGAVFNKLLQVSLGYVYSDHHGERRVVELDNGVRLDALIDAIASTDRKVIVFSPFTHALEGICKRLTQEGIEHARIDGSTPGAARSHIFSAFQQTDKYKVIAAHPNTMSHGLTLVAANTVIWFGPTTSLEIYEQANARVRRIGQEHRQQIIMFQSTPAEQRVYARLRQRQKVQDNLLAMFAEMSSAD